MRPEAVRGFTLSAGSGLAALIGGLLWIVKSLSILIADKQPDFTFEVAPFFFALATLGVVSIWEPTRTRPSRNVRRLTLFAAVVGGVATIAYVVGGDEGLVGPALAATVLIVVAVLGYTGRDIRRSHALGALGALPFALALLFVLAIPVGAVLENLNERLLEIPLLGIGIGWVVLSSAATEFTPLKWRVSSTESPS